MITNFEKFVRHIYYVDKKIKTICGKNGRKYPIYHYENVCTIKCFYNFLIVFTSTIISKINYIWIVNTLHIN